MNVVAKKQTPNWSRYHPHMVKKAYWKNTVDLKYVGKKEKKKTYILPFEHKHTLYIHKLTFASFFLSFFVNLSLSAQGDGATRLVAQP